MTRPTLLKIICGLALLYAIMWAHEQDYQRIVSETSGFWSEIEKADKARAEKFRLGKAGR